MVEKTECAGRSQKVRFKNKLSKKLWKLNGQQKLIVRQIQADKLTISRGNSILVLSCPFKVSKYISECWPR